VLLSSARGAQAMIELTQGDILKANAEALVNTVNCVGVMGRGVALQFKKAYPENFKAYKAACDAKAVRPGKMFVFDLNQLYSPRLIINFPTKRHWRYRTFSSEKILEYRTFLSDTIEEWFSVNDREFKKRLRKLAKQEGVEYRESRQGKGSHSRVYYGNNFTTLKHGEIGTGLLNQMCKQLGIDKNKLMEV
jgi:hypothetical protein